MRKYIDTKISLGHIMVAVSFLASFGLVELPRASDVKVLQAQQVTTSETMRRHEESLEQTQIKLNQTAQNLEALSQMLKQHISWSKSPSSGSKQP